MNTSSWYRPKSCEPIYVLDDSMLYRLEIWSEQEWTSLPSDCRPQRAVQMKGLGCVGLVAISEPNGQTPALSVLDRRRAERRQAYAADATGRHGSERRSRERRRPTCESRRWGIGIKRDDGKVILEPEP